MKNNIFLIVLFISFSSLSQENTTIANKKTAASTVSVSSIINTYLKTIGAVDNKLDSITSITTKYKSKTAMGEFIMEKISTQDKITEKLYVSGSLMLEVIATKDKCYQVTNGEKKLLPGALCDDFKTSIAVIPELNLLELKNLVVTEVEFDGEMCYSIEIPGKSTTQKSLFSSTTGLKVKEVSITKTNDKVTENPTLFKDYTSYNNLKFPSVKIFTNFMSAGIKAEFKLEEVKYN